MAKKDPPHSPVKERVDTYFVNQLPPIDPFEPPHHILPSILNAALATALFRCWHLILLSTAWAACITLICDKVKDISVQSTLLTVLGTVLGFIISYRTSSSFDRYNEGRRYWSSIIWATRTFARTLWFHVPDTWPNGLNGDLPKETQQARSLIEKKTILNILCAYSVAVKHYLRGEEGIQYEDLYHLIKFLPSYKLPSSVPPNLNLSQRNLSPPSSPLSAAFSAPRAPNGLVEPAKYPHLHDPVPPLLPARNPPPPHLFDIFPFSLLVKALTKKGHSVKGRKAARERVRLQKIITHNIPLEITLYLSSYVASLQGRKHLDVPTVNGLTGALNTLVDSLSGLERILTTPIPFSYSAHLWSVTILYCFFLPFQIYKTMGFVTIPSTAIVSFIFFGFLVAGEEIENPFGYDKNDLNLDHFTHNIIIPEIIALTSRPVPDISVWAFSPDNDALFWEADVVEDVHPDDWVRRGTAAMKTVMERASRAGVSEGDPRKSDGS